MLGITRTIRCPGGRACGEAFDRHAGGDRNDQRLRRESMLARAKCVVASICCGFTARKMTSACATFATLSPVDRGAGHLERRTPAEHLRSDRWRRWRSPAPFRLARVRARAPWPFAPRPSNLFELQASQAHCSNCIFSTISYGNPLRKQRVASNAWNGRMPSGAQTFSHLGTLGRFCETSPPLVDEIIYKEVSFSLSFEEARMPCDTSLCALVGVALDSLLFAGCSSC